MKRLRTNQDITKHPQYQQAHEYVLALAQKKPMQPDEFILNIKRTLIMLTGGAAATWPQPPIHAWKECHQHDYVRCMICGEKFQVISLPHIKSHGGSSKQEYMEWFGIPEHLGLACQAYIIERRASIKKHKIWEKRSYRSSKCEYAEPIDQAEGYISAAEAVQRLDVQDFEVISDWL